MGQSRQAKRKAAKKKKIDMGGTTADPIEELGGIIAETKEIREHATAQSERLDSFIESVTDKGAPEKVIDAVKHISSALGEEVDKINTANEKYDKIQEELTIVTITDKRKFDLEASALDAATTIMQASFNIGTILEDLEKARKLILDNTVEKEK